MQLAVAVKALCIERARSDRRRRPHRRRRADQPATATRACDRGPRRRPRHPAAMRPHIFDPFYSGREAGRGLGFGLSKCWRIVTAHGGAVTPPNAATAAPCRPSAINAAGRQRESRGDALRRRTRMLEPWEESTKPSAPPTAPPAPCCSPCSWPAPASAAGRRTRSTTSRSEQLEEKQRELDAIAGQLAATRTRPGRQQRAGATADDRRRAEKGGHRQARDLDGLAQAAASHRPARRRRSDDRRRRPADVTTTVEFYEVDEEGKPVSKSAAEVRDRGRPRVRRMPASRSSTTSTSSRTPSTATRRSACSSASSASTRNRRDGYAHRPAWHEPRVVRRVRRDVGVREADLVGLLDTRQRSGEGQDWESGRPRRRAVDRVRKAPLRARTATTEVTLRPLAGHDEQQAARTAEAT